MRLVFVFISPALAWGFWGCSGGLWGVRALVEYIIWVFWGQIPCSSHALKPSVSDGVCVSCIHRCVILWCLVVFQAAVTWLHLWHSFSSVCGGGLQTWHRSHECDQQQPTSRRQQPHTTKLCVWGKFSLTHSHTQTHNCVWTETKGQSIL